jgi:butyryl-CoA dehydrogenase
MFFKLSEEHEMIRKMVRDFAKNEVAPTAAQRDEEELHPQALLCRLILL